MKKSDGEPPSNRNAAYQRKHRAKLSAAKGHGVCSICGGQLRGEISRVIGYHQKCDRAGYQARYREIKGSREK